MSTESTIISDNLPEGYLIVEDPQDGRSYPQRKALDGGAYRFSTRRALDGGSSSYTPISFPEVALARALIALDAARPRGCEWGNIVYQAEELPRMVALLLNEEALALEHTTDQGILYPGFAHGHLTREQEIYYDILEVPVAQEPEGRSAIYFLIQDSWPDEPKELTVDGQGETGLDLGGYCIVSSMGAALAELALLREQLAEQ